MLDLQELLRDQPVHVQNRLYEQMAQLGPAEQERFRNRIALALEELPEQHADPGAAAAREAREARAPGVGDEAPDFDLAVLDSDRRIRLSKLRGRPVGLIFGSYT